MSVNGEAMQSVANLRQSMRKAFSALDVNQTGVVDQRAFLSVIPRIFPTWTDVDIKLMLRRSKTMAPDGHSVDWKAFTKFIVCDTSSPGNAPGPFAASAPRSPCPIFKSPRESLGGGKMPRAPGTEMRKQPGQERASLPKKDLRTCVSRRNAKATRASSAAAVATEATDRAEPEPEEQFAAEVALEKLQFLKADGGLGAFRARHEACVDQLRSIVEYIRELEADNSELRCSHEELRVQGEQLRVKNMRLQSQLRMLRLENGLTQPGLRPGQNHHAHAATG
jgi:hypothetical protein